MPTPVVLNVPKTSLSQEETLLELCYWAREDPNVSVISAKRQYDGDVEVVLEVSDA